VALFIGIRTTIKQRVVAACREESGRPYAVILISQTNEMLDAISARRLALTHHPPAVVYILLLQPTYRRVIRVHFQRMGRPVAHLLSLPEPCFAKR
jgi:hypothetical protein